MPGAAASRTAGTLLALPRATTRSVATRLALSSVATQKISWPPFSWIIRRSAAALSGVKYGSSGCMGRVPRDGRSAGALAPGRIRAIVSPPGRRRQMRQAVRGAESVDNRGRSGILKPKPARGPFSRQSDE